MLNERDDIQTIFRDMTKSLDGATCIAACMLSFAMAALNTLMPEVLQAGSAGRTGKWLAIWFWMPLLLFLIYLRCRQLMDGSGRAWVLIRSITVLSPVFVLIYFNL